MNSLKEAFSMQNLLKNLNFFGELNLGLILTAWCWWCWGSCSSA